MNIRNFLITNLVLTFTFFFYSKLQSQSPLSNGTIYKIGISKTGIQKIDANFLQSTLNVDLNSIDPRNISIYGLGGGPLPELININFPLGLIENPIYVSGQDDGSFDGNDFILFYGEGPDNWSYDYNKNKHLFHKNIYDDNNYYFIKINDTPGQRIQSIFQPSGADITLDEIENRMNYQTDIVNLLGEFNGTEGTGQTWYGELFTTNGVQDFSDKFPIRNLVPGSQAQFEISMVGRGSQSSTVSVGVGQDNFSGNFSKVSTGEVLDTYASSWRTEQNITLNNIPNVTIKYNPSTNSNAWLDYIQLVVRQNATYQNSPILLLNSASLGNVNAAYNISGANTSLFSWDVSTPYDVKALALQNSFGGAILNFEVHDMVKEFMVFDPNGNHNIPSYISTVENQEITQTDDEAFIIVYYKDFLEAAQKLANHRESRDNIKTKLVDIDHIYNEFGSGKADPTALRNYARYIFENNSDFKFLLLFGDGSYDYKGIMPGLEYQNFVPTYETKQTLNPILGFPTDDYFGLLNENEGNPEISGILDIAIGRIPARSAEDAMTVVDKIIYYDTSPAVLGDWKLNVGFAADDEDQSRHLTDSDRLAVYVDTTDEVFNQQKVYFDAYEQVSTPGGTRFPAANEALIQNLNKGQLLLNYLGHGGPKGWAQERVLQINDINGLENMNTLPVIITATCSFTGFDDPGLVTAGELLLSNPKGGAVGLFTTVRAVFADKNYNLAQSVYNNIFKKKDGRNMPLGEIMKIAKNELAEDEDNKRKFTYIGDPTMQLTNPTNHVILEKINEIDVEQFTDTITALQEVKLSGYIEDPESNLLSDFNGVLSLTVFDKKKEIKTLSNDGNVSPSVKFDIQKNVLFKGSASVVNGKFSIEFILPKDINFNNGLGKFSFYADDGVSKDAAGHYNKVWIGGSIDAVADDSPPIIELFMNDENFAYGGITDDSPTLLVKLKDDYGINVSGTSVGHDLTFVLDDQNDQSVVINDFYEATTNDFRSGAARYPLKNLSPGNHKIRVKAWDISNNSVESEIEFNVVDPDNKSLYHVYNYPNPFTSTTNFMFESDLDDSELNISVEIYTISGKTVKVIEASRFSTGYRINDISWDGKDDFGSKLAKGIYLYKIKIESPSTGLKRESDFQKSFYFNITIENHIFAHENYLYK